VVDWQDENEELLSGLAAQSGSSFMIQAFVLVAVALGIASTLAISAVQKTSQIGILKAMGMTDGRRDGSSCSRRRSSAWRGSPPASRSATC
jgi:ABC-type lipoprotein release transport system permease subunit